MNTTERRTRTAAALALAAAAILSGCSATSEDEGPRHSAPSTAGTTTAATRPAEDIIQDFRAEITAGESAHLTDVSVPEPGRLEILTDLKDPGRSTSAETMFARTMCETGARLEGVTYVSVHEYDGTSWVLFGHPAGPVGECFLP